MWNRAPQANPVRDLACRHHGGERAVACVQGFTASLCIPCCSGCARSAFRTLWALPAAQLSRWSLRTEHAPHSRWAFWPVLVSVVLGLPKNPAFFLGFFPPPKGVLPFLSGVRPPISPPLGAACADSFHGRFDCVACYPRGRATRVDPMHRAALRGIGPKAGSGVHDGSLASRTEFGGFEGSFAKINKGKGIRRRALARTWSCLLKKYSPRVSPEEAALRCRGG